MRHPDDGGNTAFEQINNWGEHPHGPHHMPVILKPEDFDQWLGPFRMDFDKIDALQNIMNHPEEVREYITVAIDAEGNIPNAPESLDSHTYEELDVDPKSLK